MIAAPSRGESLTWRVSWLTFAKTAGFALSIALPLLLVRRMDQEQYGLYKQAFLVITTAMTVLPMGFSMSAFYFLPREPERRRSTVLNIFVFNAAVGAAAGSVLTRYPSIFTTIFQGPQLSSYSGAISLAIFFWIAGAFLEVIPIANDEIRLASAFILGTQASRALIFVGAALLYGTVRSLILAAILQGAIQTAALILYLHSRFPAFWRSLDWRLLRSQLSYAIPLGSASLLLTMQTDLHNYFVSNRYGPAMFAIYSFGTLQLPLMALIQEATNSVLIARVSALQQRGESREIILLTTRAARKLAAVYFPVYALLLVVGPEFIRFLFTGRYSASWPIFAVNLTLLPLGVLLLDPLLRAYRSERYFLLCLRIGLLAALILTLLLGTRQLGLLGVISVVVGFSILERAVMAIHFARLLGVTRADGLLLRDIGKLAAASLAAALACALARSLLSGASPFTVLAACGPVFAFVYLSAVHMFRIPSPDEYHQLSRLVARFRRFS
jgi:O-antigen/teichoic acid export membrane protein